jgi:glucose 1-dehydrogenase
MTARSRERNSMRLKDKVALITGASSGIGRGIAGRFAAEGAHVVVNYLPGGERREQAEAQVAAYPTAGLAVGGDVSIRADVERMVAEAVARFGRLDIAINNAGIEIHKPFLEVTDEQWNQVISVNLFGSYLVSQVACRQMVRQGGGGKLLFISSTHEDIPYPGYTAYCASKGGIRMLMRNLAVELAPHRINVNSIAPGAIATPINQAFVENPTALQEASAEIPWGRFGRVEEVAAVALFLASEEADYVTGSTYYIDGGLSRQVPAC